MYNVLCNFVQEYDKLMNKPKIIVFSLTKKGGLDYAQNMSAMITDADIFVSDETLFKTDKKIQRVKTYTNKFQFFVRTPLFLFRGFFLLINLIRKYKKNIILYFPVFHPWNLILVIFARVLKIKTIITVHDYINHIGEENVFINWFQRSTIFFANEVIFLTQSESLKMKMNIAQGKINIIPDPIVSLFGKPLSYTFNQKPAVLFLGRISKYKGIDILMNAFEKFEDRISNLTIAGELMDSKIQIPKHPKIQFLDEYIPNETIKELFVNHHILILPYIDASQSGILSIGIGCGIPMIISDLPGLREQLREDCACWVTPGDSDDIVRAVQWLNVKENYESLVDHMKNINANQNQDIKRLLYAVFNKL